MGLGRWMTSCPEAWAEDFGIWKKAVCWVPACERESQHSELGEARRLCALRAPCVCWVESWRCKISQHRKIVSLSPHVEKPLNSKRWIKVSYLNQFREFRVFRFPMSISHIRILWVCYIRSMQNKLREQSLCFDVARGRMNGTPNETRTHSCRFASQVC